MKKIIAISVMFALVIGAAFADTTIGGGFQVHVDLAVDKNQSDGDNAGAGNFGFGDRNLNINWSGDNAGGFLRLTAGGDPYFAFAWWKPIDQLRFQIGKNADGDWGHSQIVGWGFTGSAKSAGVGSFIGDYNTPFAGDQATGFMGGWGNAGLAISIYPADGFEIDLGIPMDKTVTVPGEGYHWKYPEATASGGGAATWGTPTAEANTTSHAAPASVAFSNTLINVKADIPNIGTARLGLQLRKENAKADLLTDIYLAFYLSAIENMGAEVGIAVTTSDKGSTANKKNDQIDLGIGFKYEAGDLGLKAALGIGLAGEGRKEGSKKIMPFTVQLLPSYNLGSLTAFANVGVGTTIGAKESVVGFWFNPYVQVPVSSGNFYAGIKFYNSGEKGADAAWAIPIGWDVSF